MGSEPPTSALHQLSHLVAARASLPALCGPSWTVQRMTGSSPNYRMLRSVRIGTMCHNPTYARPNRDCQPQPHLSRRAASLALGSASQLSAMDLRSGFDLSRRIIDES